MRIGTLQIEVRSGRRRRVVRADLTARVPGPRVRITGTLLRAVTRALELARRDDRSWAVLQAARGQYELVPLTLAGYAAHSEVDALAELTSVPGVAEVSIARRTGQLVAVAGARHPYVFEGDVVSLTDRN